MVGNITNVAQEAAVQAAQGRAVVPASPTQLQQQPAPVGLQPPKTEPAQTPPRQHFVYDPNIKGNLFKYSFSLLKRIIYNIFISFSSIF